MTKEEIKNKISEHKECCKKLAEEYRQRYNEDKTDKLALNMFYHNVIAYNDFENVLAMIEDRNSMMLCFAEPPILTEKTVEVDINRIAELEQKISVLLSCKNCPENKGGYICEKEYEDKCLAQKIQYIKELQEENTELKDKLNNLSKVAEVRLANWQKYEQENAELKKQVSYLGDNLRVARKDRENLQLDVAKGLKEFVKDYPATAFRYLANEKYVEKLTKAKEIIRDLLSCLYSVEYDCVSDLEEAEQFLKECE